MLFLRRALASLLGASIATAGVSLLEARPLGPGALVAVWGVLAPIGVVVGLAIGLALLLLDRQGPTGPLDLAAAVRREPVLSRSRTAAAVPVVVLLAFVWTLATAHVTRHLLATATPRLAGLTVTASALGNLLVLAALGLSLVAPLRRALALGAAHFPRLIDPVFTGGIAFLAVVTLFAHGVRSGDTGGGGGTLGILGVLRRSELDLRPVGHLALIGLGAYAAPLLMRRRASVYDAVGLLLGGLLPLLLLVPSARLMDAGAGLARSLETRAPLGRVALALARRATDADRDGASRTFGGGDCDDRDARRHPSALDVPGNGVDEDCSGADTPRVEKPTKSPPALAPAAQARALPEGLSVVLVTIDTLRPDLGFLGYDLPVSPNLDRLAKKSTVFERAYAPASYTGKSLAPILIGKYPSETLRNGSHFNTYEPGNVTVTERLAAAKVATLGAASHWYFMPWSGLTQGFDRFDLSAKPSSGQGDTDTSITSPALTEAALALFAQAEKKERFFLWVHYFDPHAQYMDHAGGPSFVRPGKTGYVESVRAAYDKEIWFTDKHLGRLLDRIEKSPRADKIAIVVTSDHGEAFAEHNMNWHGVELWESIVRVPLFVYVPGQPARRVADRRALIDLAPTLLDLYRLPAPPPGELSGESMVGDLTGEPSPGPRDVYLDMPVGPYNGVRRALITGPGAGRKILHFGGTQYSVFDLASDPGEVNDLAGEAETLAPLRDALQRFRGRLQEIEVQAAPP